MIKKKIDPYQAGMVKGDAWVKVKKRVVKGKIVVVADRKWDNRGYQLIPMLSRAVLSNEIHELISTDETKPKPGEEVNSGGVIGFVEFTAGGVIVVGDKVTIGKKEIGYIAGFDETHFPNHLNIIIKTDKRLSGFDLNIKLEDDVNISR